jgi:hydroxymethylpyrimidine/phosphomethylpyrimidine kinase
MQTSAQPPVVLVIAGNDPSGGAGLGADIQALTALGAHPAPVVSALTVQDTVNATRVEPVTAELVCAQARAVLADLPVAAVKLGLLANAEIGEAVAGLLAEYADLPVILDPVLVAAGGAALAEDALLDVYLSRLIPAATVVTPNADESRRLAPTAESADARAQALIAAGANWVLLKGGDEDTADVCNRLYGAHGLFEENVWPRLPGTFHGSGCTLASAIAAHIARGETVPTAVADAQRWTWNALQSSWKLGRGQAIPNRHGQR